MKILVLQSAEEEVRNIASTMHLRWPDCGVVSGNGSGGVEAIERETPELVFLDVAANGSSGEGLALIENIRSFSDVPLVMLVPKDNQMSIINGLEIGADDYVVKPFSPAELLAKVVALLRRVHGTMHIRAHDNAKFGDLTLNFTTREVSIRGERVRLTPTEYSLLTYLVRNEGKVLTHSMLLEKVWGPTFDDPGFVKKYIYRLRSKLRDDAREPRMLVSERGIGYRFVRPV